AFGSAGEVPGLLALTAGCGGVLDRKSLVGAARVAQYGVGLFVVPDVGIAAPVLIPVFLGAAELLEVKEAGFQPLSARRIALLHLKEERLDGDRAVRELPAARRAGRWLRILNSVVLDLAVAWDGEEPLLACAVGPELCVDGVRNKSWSGLQ